MKRFLSALAMALWSILLLAGDYELKPVTLLPIESYPARTSLGSVTIAADPYDSDDKSFTAFDVKKLNSRGYYPIHVIIQNGSSEFLIVRTRNIVLVTESGQHLYTTPASVLVEDVFKASAADKLSSKSRKSDKPVKEGTPLSDFTEKDLTNKLIEPGKITGGFLFFFSSDPKKNPFTGSTLYIPKIEEEGTRKATGPFLIPLASALSKSK
jgi:hypothetical protein